MRVLLETSARARSSAAGSPGLLEAPAQLPIERDVATAQLLDGALCLLLEIRLAAIEVIEASSDLARDLHVRDLILADGHEGRTVQQDVGALQQRVTEKAVGREILVLELLLLILVGRHALEPGERCDHRQQQVQLSVLGYVRLHEQRRHARIESSGEPVDHDLADRLLQTRGVLVPGGQRVPVGNEEKALVLILQLDPVTQSTVIVAQMQRAGGSHARQHALAWENSTHPARLTRVGDGPLTMQS